MRVPLYTGVPRMISGCESTISWAWDSRRNPASAAFRADLHSIRRTLPSVTCREFTFGFRSNSLASPRRVGKGSRRNPRASRNRNKICVFENSRVTVLPSRFRRGWIRPYSIALCTAASGSPVKAETYGGVYPGPFCVFTFTFLFYPETGTFIGPLCQDFVNRSRQTHLCWIL